MKKEKEIIVIQDGFIASVVADTYMFVSIIVILVVNHYLLDDSTFGAWLFSIIFILTFLGRVNNRITRLKGKEELKEYLNNL